MSDRTFIAAADLTRMAREGKAPANPLVRVSALPQLKAINDQTRSIDFCISDASFDRDNDSINVNGWDLNNYLKNPVVLWAHDPTQPPVAKAENTRVSGKELISTAVFAPPDLSQFADMIYRMYKGGFMSATSVGFKPNDYEFRSGPEGFIGCDFKAQELLEYSCVPVPANANALMRAKSSGIDTMPLVEWLEKAMDGEGKLILPRDVAERLRKAAKGTSVTRIHLSGDAQADLARRNLARGELDGAFPDAKAGEFYGAASTPALKWVKGESGIWEPADREDGDTVLDIALAGGFKASALIWVKAPDPEQPELEEASVSDNEDDPEAGEETCDPAAAQIAELVAEVRTGEQSAGADDPDQDDIDPESGGEKGEADPEEDDIDPASGGLKSGQIVFIGDKAFEITSKDGGSWECSAARDLSIDKESSWDGAAAKASVFEHFGFGGDKPDTVGAAKAFLAHDSSKPTEKGAYKLPFAKVKDGKLVAVKAGIDAAANRLSGTQIPESVKKSAQGVIDHYQKKAGEGDDDGKSVVLRLVDAPAPSGVRIKMKDGSIADESAIGLMVERSLARAINRAKGVID